VKIKKEYTEKWISWQREDDDNRNIKPAFDFLIRTTATSFGKYQPFFSPFRSYSLKYHVCNAFEGSDNLIL